MTVTVQEAGASLTLSAGPPALEFELPKVPGPEAACRLQALTLSLAERVCALERRLAGRGGAGAPQPHRGTPSLLPPVLAFPPQLPRR